MSYADFELSETFLGTLLDKQFSQQERQQFKKALKLLDSDEQHPSLRVHQLEGKDRAVWSASASTELRITFERQPGGKKRLMASSRHYQR